MHHHQLLKCSSLRLFHIRKLAEDATIASTSAASPPFSSFPLLRQEALASPFRCLENNPNNHMLNHVGQYYKIQPDDSKWIFLFGGLHREFQRKIKTFSEFCLMVRKPAVEVINCIKCTNFSYPVNRYVLYGLNGCGKTLSLAHILHFISLQQDFLILHAPWPAMWSRMFKEIAPSLYRPGRMDHPVEAVAWLQQFKMQNQFLLQEKQPKIVNSYVWSQREKTEKGSLLTDIVEQGINRAKFSSDCVAVILKESKLLATSGQLKVAVIIDGVNTFFYQRTRVKREDKSIVPAKDLTLVHAFTKLLKNDWNNGVIVTSVDTIAAPSECRESHFPRYLLGKKGFEIMDPFVPVAVENYTEKEINSCLDYYIDRLWIQSERGRTEEGRQQLLFLSGHNPHKLMELCGPW